MKKRPIGYGKRLLKSPDCLYDFTVERTGEYRHEWLLDDKDVAQEQTPDLKRFDSKQIHQKWISLTAEINKYNLPFYLCIHF